MLVHEEGFFALGYEYDCKVVEGVCQCRLIGL